MKKIAAVRGHAEPRRRWSLFSNHGVVLVFVARRPESTVREMAGELGIRERHVVRILRDLVEARMLDVRKVAARNVYRVRGSTRLRHPTMTSSRVRDLVDLLAPKRESPSRTTAGRNGAGAMPSGARPSSTRRKAAVS